MLQETEDLIKNGVDSKWLITLGLDYKVMTNYLKEISNDKSQISNKISRPQSQGDSLSGQANPKFQTMKEDLKTKEHQYAKRQLTWWKRFNVKWIDDYKEATRLVSEFLVK